MSFDPKKFFARLNHGFAKRPNGHAGVNDPQAFDSGEQADQDQIQQTQDPTFSAAWPFSQAFDRWAGGVDAPRHGGQASPPASAGVGLYPEMLLSDDGAMTPVQGAPAVGASTNAAKSVATATPAPTLVGTAGGLEFDLIWDSSVARAPAAFMSAVETAAGAYAKMFSNKEIVNVAIGYGEIGGQSLASGALAESMSYGYLTNYATVAGDLKKDATSSGYQATADASLAAVDPTKGGSFYVASAEAKALGMVGGGGSSLDGYVGISSSFNFSYSQSSVAANQYDAIGAVEHELSEVMGRVSSDGSLFGRNIYTPLDLFRYTSAATRDLVAGQGYFSINGGVTNLGTYNNPLKGGDSGDWTPSLVGDSYGDGYLGHSALLSPTDLVEDATLGYTMTAAAVAATRIPGLA